MVNDRQFIKSITVLRHDVGRSGLEDWICKIMKEKVTMQEYLSWRKSLELPYGEFESLVAGDEDATRHLPPKVRQEMVPAKGLRGILGSRDLVTILVTQPEKVEVVFTRNFSGQTTAEVVCLGHFNFSCGQATTEKLARLADVPIRHDLPDVVVETPPVPTWLHLGQGCYCGNGDYGHTCPRFRWEILAELEELREQFNPVVDDR